MNISITILKRTKANGKTPVYVMYSHKSEKFLINTHVEINPNEFDKKSRSLKGRKYSGNSIENKRIKTIKNKLIKLVDTAILNEIDPSIHYIKGQYYNTNDNDKKDVIGRFESFIEYAKTDRKPATIKQYRTCLNSLKQYEKYNGKRIQFIDLNLSFYNSYREYLISVKGLVVNTVGSRMKNLKVFLNYLRDNGIYEAKDIKKIKVEREEFIPMVLTDEEIKKIEKLKFNDPKLEYLQKYKDVLKIGMYTGLRIGDILALKTDNITKIEGQTYLSKITQKGKKPVQIPIFKNVSSIFKKYQNSDGSIVPTITDQKFNKYIKLICKLAGINEIVEKVRTQGHQTKTISDYKYNLVASHIMRRTFITQALKKNMNANLVMSITGHTDTRSFNRYVNLTEINHVTQEMTRAFQDS